MYLYSFDFSNQVNSTATPVNSNEPSSINGVDQTVDNSAIKIYLTNMDNDADSGIIAPTKISNLSTTTGSEAYNAPSGEFILLNGTMNTSTSHKYRLRMWVADDYTEPSGGTYTLKVNVYGAAAAL